MLIKALRLNLIISVEKRKKTADSRNKVIDGIKNTARGLLQRLKPGGSIASATNIGKIGHT